MLDVQTRSGEAGSSQACGKNLLAAEDFDAVVDLPAPIAWSAFGGLRHPIAIHTIGAARCLYTGTATILRLPTVI